MGTTERESMKYASGDDFRKALSDTLKRRYPDLNVDSLFKRVAMERFLARIAVHFGERALLKGGYALELRLARARSTKDLDLALLEIAAGEALEALRDAGELDLGDYFHYRIERNRRGTPQGAPEGGERLTVVPELGGRPFRPFPLDVGVGDALPTGHDRLRGGIDLAFAGLAPLEVPAVPVEVHLAEKLHALSFPRPDGRVNTRVKDLVDVMLLIEEGLPRLELLRTAVAATFERRGSHPLPERFELPLEVWLGEYERFASELGIEGRARTIEEADEELHGLLTSLEEGAVDPR